MSLNQFPGINIDRVHLTKEQKQHYDRLARIGCILCYHLSGQLHTPAEIHHIRRYGAKREDCEVIPLCPEHHRGDTGIHSLGRKGQFESRYRIDEQGLLEKTQVLLKDNRSY